MLSRSTACLVDRFGEETKVNVMGFSATGWHCSIIGFILIYNERKVYQSGQNILQPQDELHNNDKHLTISSPNKTKYTYTYKPVVEINECNMPRLS